MSTSIVKEQTWRGKINRFTLEMTEAIGMVSRGSPIGMLTVVGSQMLPIAQEENRVRIKLTVTDLEQLIELAEAGLKRES